MLLMYFKNGLTGLNSVIQLDNRMAEAEISPDFSRPEECLEWLKNVLGPAKTGPQEAMGRRPWVIVKRGKEFQILKIADIVYFFSENKAVFAVDRDNRKFLFEKGSLGKLEQQLDSRMFYRANRKYLVNAEYIRSFKPVARYRVRLQINPEPAEDIVVSQENATEFKRWIGAD